MRGDNERIVKIGFFLLMLTIVTSFFKALVNVIENERVKIEMNEEMKKELEPKINEIKEIIKKYVKPLYGDIEINSIDIEEEIYKKKDGSTKQKIRISVDTNKGDFDIESPQEEEESEEEEE